MNPFEQLLRYGQQAPKSTLIDTVANPESYRTVSRGVQEVLQRNMPSSYGGLGIQNAPTNLIGEVNDIANMPSGRAKEAARNSLQRKFQMASQLDSPTSLKGAGQARSGALRAPNLPGNPRQYDFLNPRGIRAPSGPYTPDLNATFQGPGLPPSKLTKPPVIPTGGRPVPFVTPTGGSNPIVGSIPRGGTRLQTMSKPLNRNIIQQASQYMPKSLPGYLRPIGRGFQVLEGASLVNNLSKGNYGNALLDGVFMAPGRVLKAAKGLVPAGATGVMGTTALGLAALELGAPTSVADGTMDSPEAKQREEATRLYEYNKSQGADFDINAIKAIPSGPYNPLPNPNRNLPPSPEQVIEQTPVEKQLTQYEQGRRAATTQAEMNYVRDQGLAIHKAHNPQLYSSFRTPMASDRTFNPLMANTFPDMYPQSREAFIKEGGVQMPQSMNNVDARTEIIQGNKIEGEQRAERLTEGYKAQEFFQRFLKMKGEEEKK
jgi:hypothetical protein